MGMHFSFVVGGGLEGACQQACLGSAAERCSVPGYNQLSSTPLRPSHPMMMSCKALGRQATTMLCTSTRFSVPARRCLAPRGMGGLALPSTSAAARLWPRHHVLRLAVSYIGEVVYSLCRLPPAAAQGGAAAAGVTAADTTQCVACYAHACTCLSSVVLPECS